MGNPGGDLPAEGAVHAAASGSKAVVSCGSWGRPAWLQGCRGPGSGGAVGLGWGRSGRPRGSGRLCVVLRVRWGASGPKDLKLNNVTVSLL